MPRPVILILVSVVLIHLLVAWLFLRSFHELSSPVVIGDEVLNLSNAISDSYCFSKYDPIWGAAMRRMSDHCQARLKHIVCGGLGEHPLNITTECPDRANLEFSPRLLGCFKVSSSRLLTIMHQEITEYDKCTRFCYLAGIRYAFTTINHVCACDNKFPLADAQVAPDFCSGTCSFFPPSATSPEQLSSSYCNNTAFVQIFHTGAIPPFHLSVAPIRSLTKVPDIQPIRIVYLLVWHGRSWFQMRRIFRLIYHPRHYYYIHVDSRSTYLFQQARLLATHYPQNVHVTERRWTALWGGSGLLRMMLYAMHDLIVLLGQWHWDFFINMSGTDMPVRPREVLVMYLSEHRGKLFFGVNSDIPQFIISQGVGRIFTDCDQYIWNLGKRPLPTGIVLDGGSDWMVLPREFVEYVTFNQDPVFTQLVNYFNYSLLPVEMFFHVVAQNTRFCRSIVNRSLRFAHWDRPRGCECKHDIAVDWCGCSPVAFRGSRGLRRLCRLVGTCVNQTESVNPVFFARKFDSTVDLNLVNFVASTFLNENSNSLTWNFYLENIYHAVYDDIDHKEVSQPYASVLQTIAKHIFEKLIGQIQPSLRLPFSLMTHPQLNVYALFNASDQGISPINESDSLPQPSPNKLVLQTQANIRLNASWSILVWVETLVEVPFLGWMSGTPVSHLAFGNIVYAEVTNMFDGKEQFVRNYPRVLLTNDRLQLILYWKGLPQGPTALSSTTIHVDLAGPAERSCVMSSVMTLQRKSNTQTAFSCPSCLISVSFLSSLFPKCTMVPGFSTLSIHSSYGQELKVPFYLFATIKPLLSSNFWNSSGFPWSSLDHCFELMNDTMHFSIGQSVLTRLNCVQRPWSTLAKDPKSELPHL